MGNLIIKFNLNTLNLTLIRLYLPQIRSKKEIPFISTM